MKQVLQPDLILVSVSEAGRRLSLSRATIYKLLNSGELRGVKSGGRTLIPTQALSDYADLLLSYVPSATDGEKAKPAASTEAAPGFSRMLRIKAVIARTGLGRTSIYMRAASGTFPNKISLGGRASGWRESEVDAWIADPAGYRAKP